MADFHGAPEAATPAKPAVTEALVPEEVSLTKLGRQLRVWRENAELFRSRGWLLLDVDRLTVDVGFLADVPAGSRTWPVMTACLRLHYDNFDLWPPSVTFLDPLTRTPVLPLVGAPERVGDEVRNALVLGHPTTRQPFLCLPGVREYHSHPQHSGNHWLLHRTSGAGNLTVVCERVWRRMARNVIGVSVNVLVLPFGARQVECQLMQGDPEGIAADIAAAQQAAGVATGDLGGAAGVVPVQPDVSDLTVDRQVPLNDTDAGAQEVRAAVLGVAAVRAL